MCVTIDGKLAIMGALYKRQKCYISEINQIADKFIEEFDDININLNNVTISEFISSRAKCFSFDNKTGLIEKINIEYEFPKKTIEYYLSDLPKSDQKKVIEMFFVND